MSTTGFSNIVLDNGSGVCRAGFSGEEEPRSTISSLVGYSKKSNVPESSDSYIGSQAQVDRDMLSMKYPMNRGIINNWEDMEKIWSYVFHTELKISPQDHPVLLTEGQDSKGQREKIAQIMFEKFKIPALVMANQSVLSMLATGRVSGIVLYSGHGTTQAVPIYEGFLIHSAVQRIGLAGCDMTNYLNEMLSEKGYAFNSSADKEVVREVKEKYCYVALDPEKEIATNTQKSSYKLPDGRVISLEKERFLCSEALFEPSLIGIDADGIHKTIHNSIMKCEIDVRRQMYGEIMLSGGNTMYPNIAERLHKEIAGLSLSSTTIKIVAQKDRDLIVWKGGSILAGINTFYEKSVSKEEFDEYGSSIVHKKCI